MDDPMAIATRYATITRKMVNDATQVANDAFNKINGAPGSYTGDDAIKSMTQLANIAITGGQRLPGYPCRSSRTTARCWLPTRSHRLSKLP